MATKLEAAAVKFMLLPDILLGDFLADMRSWLDSQNIETVGITIASGQFEIRFNEPTDARRFEQRFA